MDPAHVNVGTWTEEVATLARIIAATDGYFTDGEKAYWTRRLVYAYAVESERGAA